MLGKLESLLTGRRDGSLLRRMECLLRRQGLFADVTGKPGDETGNMSRRLKGLLRGRGGMLREGHFAEKTGGQMSDAVVFPFHL